MARDDDSGAVTEAAATVSRWEDTLGFRRDAKFLSTRWTLVARARAGTEREVAEAMGEICRCYWYPLYAYVRRKGYGREEAEDLTQEFFARLLEKDTLSSAEEERGKLRTFLLTVMKRFLVDEWKRGKAEKRGGGRVAIPINFDEGEERYGYEPVESVTPDQLYEKQWAMTLLGRVMEVLRLDYAGRGMEERFEALKDALWWNSGEASYSELGASLGMNENSVKQAVSRLRKQYRKELSEEIKGTLDTDDDAAVKAELSALIGVLRS